MNVSLYPGCVIDGTAREYDESLSEVFKSLDIEMPELPDWTCCGASSAHVTNDSLAVSLAARNLGIAEGLGADLVVPCAACFQRLKVAEKHLLQGKPVEGYPDKYNGNIKILTLADYLWDTFGDNGITARVKKPLSNINPVCYYGCLTARPPEITDMKNPDDPQAMDNILSSLGANVKNWSFKTDCCGGNLALTRTDIVCKLSQRLLDMAEEAGANCIVTACPMCQSNLDTREEEISRASGRRYNTPVFYITELMGLAFGSAGVEKWISRHMVDGKPLLKEKGLI